MLFNPLYEICGFLYEMIVKNTLVILFQNFVQNIFPVFFLDLILHSETANNTI